MFHWSTWLCISLARYRYRYRYTHTKQILYSEFSSFLHPISSSYVFPSSFPFVANNTRLTHWKWKMGIKSRLGMFGVFADDMCNDIFSSFSFFLLMKGRCKKIPKFSFPPWNDRDFEILEKCIRKRWIYKHVPCWPGDWICIFGCGKENEVTRRCLCLLLLWWATAKLEKQKPAEILRSDFKFCYWPILL